MKPRESGERQHESRETDARISIRNFHLTPSNLNTDIIPEGMHWLWATKECRGYSMSSNIRQLLNMGYSPVPKSRYPNLCLADDMMVSMGLDKGKVDYIEDRDHILMEIPKKELKKIEDLNHQKIVQQNRFVSEFNPSSNDNPHVYLGNHKSHASFESGGVNLVKSNNFGSGGMY